MTSVILGIRNRRPAAGRGVPSRIFSSEIEPCSPRSAADQATGSGDGYDGRAQALGVLAEDDRALGGDLVVRLAEVDVAHLDRNDGGGTARGVRAQPSDRDLGRRDAGVMGNSLTGRRGIPLIATGFVTASSGPQWTETPRRAGWSPLCGDRPTRQVRLSGRNRSRIRGVRS